MSDAGPALFRRRPAPDRIVGDKVVIARAEADEALVLGGPLAIVWLELDHWTDVDALHAAVAEHHEGAAPGECAGAVEQALQALADEDLLERRSR